VVGDGGSGIANLRTKASVLAAMAGGENAPVAALRFLNIAFEITRGLSNYDPSLRRTGSAKF